MKKCLNDKFKLKKSILAEKHAAYIIDDYTKDGGPEGV